MARLDRPLQRPGSRLSSFRGLALGSAEPQHPRDSSQTLAEVVYLVSRFKRNCEQACAQAEQMVAENHALMRGAKLECCFDLIVSAVSS